MTLAEGFTEEIELELGLVEEWVGFGWWEGGVRLIRVEGCRSAHSNAEVTSTVPAFQRGQGCFFLDDNEEGSDGDEDGS